MNRRILLHICCGPCAAYPVQHLRAAGYDITGYFYNPNIHPYKEFTRRLEALQSFADKVKLDVTIHDDYPLENFLRLALQAPCRCDYCYEVRLRRAASYANTNHFDCFSTTLLVSPFQQHDRIQIIGEQVGREEGIPFCYVDFRPGWQEGVAVSKEMALYRQPYCGCIFSERDRYGKQPKAQPQQ